MFKRLMSIAALTGGLFVSGTSAAQQPQQQPEPITPSLVVKLSPQHIMIGGFHLDFEKTVKKQSRQALIVSPRYYNGNTYMTDAFAERKDNQGRVSGFGLELMHRYYLDGSARPNTGFYMSGGASFHRFKIASDQLGVAPFIDEETGLEYFGYRMIHYEETVDRLGLMGIIGFQEISPSNRLVVDLYAGVGHKWSKTSTNTGSARYNVSVLDYGYGGSFLAGGIKVGYCFGK